MLETFIGGYLFHPAALDYSGPTCTNGCVYCFANINKDTRKASLANAINCFYKKDATTYRDLLFKLGYPICVSNRSDPFSRNNFRETAQLFGCLAEFKNGIFVQTKCGPGMDEAIAALKGKKNVVWYITVTTMRDSLAKQIEPFAPPSSERLAWAKKLHDMGYLVVVAINPCSDIWMTRDDLAALMQHLRSIGLNHVILEMLDLKAKRIQKLSETTKANIGSAAIESCISGRCRIYVRECMDGIRQKGFSLAKKGMPYRSDFFNDLKRALGITMPVLQDFINYCFNRYPNGGPITFEEFASVITDDRIFAMTVRQNNIRDYLLRAGFLSWKDNQQVHTHKDLLRVVWNDHRNNLSIHNHCLIRATTEHDPDGNIILWFTKTPNFEKRKEVMLL